jgi:hypothetical protein
MVGSSKILTVSYGTFSCTLEGFDDSFSTMKAIAEYFRDLAADDRYFGAEPATPDAEMMARIAEREIARRVEARTDAGGIVLRVGTAAEQPATPQVQSSVAASQGVSSDTAPGPDAFAGSYESATGDDFHDLAPAATALPYAATPPHPDSVAAKLQRIRAVVGRAAPPLDAAFLRDLHAVPEAEIAEPELAATPREQADEALSRVDQIADKESGEGTAAVAATVAPEIRIDPVLDTILLATQDDGAEVTAVAAGAEADGTADLDASAATAQAPVSAPAATMSSTALGASPFDEYQMEEEDCEEETPDHGVDHPTSDLGGAAQSGWRADGDEPLPSALSPEDDAAPIAEAAQVDRDAIPDRDEGNSGAADADDALASQVDGADDDARLTAAVLKDIAPELTAEDDETDSAANDLPENALPEGHKDDDARTAAAADPLEMAEAEDTPGDGPLAIDPEGVPDAAGADLHDAVESDADLAEATDADAAAQDLAGADQIAEPVQPLVLEEAAKEPAAAASRPGRAFLRDEPEADEAAMSRILSETDAHLNDPDGSRRRQAIAQLKAAVAATEAARLMGEVKTAGADAAHAFRNDLKQVVRPRRPELSVTSPETRAARPAATPLKLVASQRVDATVPSIAPVRPRRILPEVQPEVETLDAATEPKETFAAFAAQMNATELPDLLEAAAAYTSFVEGVEDFSRPQIMKKVRHMLPEDFSREDGLRSFGTLLRQGRITRVRNGRFQVSEATRFNPQSRAG